MSAEQRFTFDRRRSAPYAIHEPATEPNGQTIALFHGISMPHTHWGELPDALGDLGYRTVTIGLAEKTRRILPTLGSYARDAAEIMDGAIGEPAHILGLSWGGFLVQQIAMDHPDQIKHVFAAATLPATPMAGIPLSPLEFPDQKALLAIASPHRSAGAMGEIYGGDFRNNLRLVQKHANLFERPINNVAHNKQQLALTSSSTLAWRRMFRLATGGRHPETTFLYGDDDPIIPSRLVERGAAVLGAKAIRIVNGGHGFLLTRPYESSKIIDSIITE